MPISDRLVDTLGHRNRRSRALAVAVTLDVAGIVVATPGATPLPPGAASVVALAGGVSWATYAGGRLRPRRGIVACGLAGGVVAPLGLAWYGATWSEWPTFGRGSAVAAGAVFATALAAEPAGAARAPRA